MQQLNQIKNSADDRTYRATTFRLPTALHTELKLMCLLTGKQMGEFIRIAIRDKIVEVKLKKR